MIRLLGERLTYDNVEELDDKLNDEHITKAVRALLTTYSKRTQKILYHRYFLEHTYDEIGEKVNLTGARASSIVRETLKDMKTKIKSVLVKHKVYTNTDIDIALENMFKAKLTRAKQYYLKRKLKQELLMTKINNGALNDIKIKQINCYVCGTWIKQNKDKEYCCPKCKAKYAIHTGKIVRIYDSYKEYIDD